MQTQLQWVGPNFGRKDTIAPATASASLQFSQKKKGSEGAFVF
jgi:hypothetical protein